MSRKLIRKQKMRPETLPTSSEENNPERISYMDLIIKELACIKVAIEKIDEIITEPSFQSELKLNYEQMEEIKVILYNLLKDAAAIIIGHRKEIDWKTITNEIQSYVKESNTYHPQRANDPNFQLKTLLRYIFERLTAAFTHAGNLYTTEGALELREKLNNYKTKIDEIYNSLYGG
jgi:hypothetical protein